jgi:hypothetical protein
MADDKKKSDKKKPEAPPSKTGHDALWEIVGFFIAASILISALTQFPVFNFFATPSTTDGTQNKNQVISGDFSFWNNLIGNVDGGSFPSAGNLTLGTDVISKGIVQIRREPGGSVIGLQSRGTMAKIVDGPISAYGTRWWMVDYENPPSGWTDEKDLTTKFFLYYVVNFFPILWGYIKIIGWILSGFFGLTIIYIAIREMFVPVYDETSPAVSSSEKAISVPSALTTTQTPPLNLPTGEYAESPEENIRWKRIELLLKSHNSSDWRQAIIEADVMLEDMLDKMGYPGVSIGDKLKNIEESDFETLDKAWEAHKVRNRIAHDGSGHKLPYDEASRVIGLYQDVFKEFYWI